MKDFVNRIVNIFGNGHFLGSGYLIESNYILTAAHIVKSCCQQNNEPSIIKISFPFLDSNIFYFAKNYKCDDDWLGDIDVAILEIGNPPREIQSNNSFLVKSNDYWHHEIRAIGFPDPYRDGIWITGRSLSKNKQGLVQLVSNQNQGYWFRRGFSGTPIWDEELQGVVGILLSTELNQEIKSALYLPNDEIIKKYPEINNLILGNTEISNSVQHNCSKEILTSVYPISLGLKFVGRESQLNKLLDCIKNIGPQIISIEGIGGIGKTALVVKGIDNVRKDYKKYNLDGILFLGWANDISIDNVFYEIGKLIHEKSNILKEISSSKEKMGIKIHMLMEVIKNQKLLIVFDNFENLLNFNGEIINPEIKLFINQIIQTNLFSKVILLSKIPVEINSNLLKYFERIPLREGLSKAECKIVSEAILGSAEWAEQVIDVDYERIFQITSGIPRAVEIYCNILVNELTFEIDTSDLYSQKELDLLVNRFVKENFEKLDLASTEIIKFMSAFIWPVPVNIFRDFLELQMKDIEYVPVLEKLIRNQYIKYDKQSNSLFLHPLDQQYFYNRIIEQPETLQYESENKLISLHKQLALFFEAEINRNQTPIEKFADLYLHFQRIDHLILGEMFLEAFFVINIIEKMYLFNWGYYMTAIKYRDKIDLANFSKNDLYIQFSRLGSLYQAVGDLENAEKFHNKSLQIAIDLGDNLRKAKSLKDLGLVSRANGEGLTALGYCRKALIISREYKLNELERMLIGYLGLIYHMLGDLDNAINMYEMALAKAIEINDKRKISHQLGNLGAAYLDLGQSDLAIMYQEKALIIELRLGSTSGIGIRQANLGAAYLSTGDLGKGLALLETSIDVSREVRNSRRESIRLNKYALGLIMQGEYTQAKIILERSLRIIQDHGNLRSESIRLNTLSYANYLLGDNRTALNQINEAIDISRGINDTWWESKHLERKIRYLLSNNNLEGVETCLIRYSDIKAKGHNGKKNFYYGLWSINTRSLTEARLYFISAYEYYGEKLRSNNMFFEDKILFALISLALYIYFPECSKREFIDQYKVLDNFRRTFKICAAKGVKADIRKYVDLLPDSGNIKSIIFTEIDE